MSLQINDIEREIILLKATWEIISSVVNKAVFDPSTSPLFQNEYYQRYFGIVMVDFLSEPSSPSFGFKKTYLEELKKICGDPKFNINNSVAGLSASVDAAIKWLAEPVSFDAGHYVDEEMWFPSINAHVNPKFSRQNLLYIYGNISKHNFTRLDSVTKKIVESFEDGVHKISKTEALLVINDMYEHLEDNVFIFHANQIAEHMNNIIWGIYDYLLPEFQKSISYPDLVDRRRYEYRYPDGVNNQFAREIYWELMNNIRGKPYLERFQISDDIKNYY